MIHIVTGSGRASRSYNDPHLTDAEADVEAGSWPALAHTASSAPGCVQRGVPALRSTAGQTEWGHGDRNLQARQGQVQGGAGSRPCLLEQVKRRLWRKAEPEPSSRQETFPSLSLNCPQDSLSSVQRGGPQETERGKWGTPVAASDPAGERQLPPYRVNPGGLGRQSHR